MLVAPCVGEVEAVRVEDDGSPEESDDEQVHRKRFEEVTVGTEHPVHNERHQEFEGGSEVAHQIQREHGQESLLRARGMMQRVCQCIYWFETFVNGALEHNGVLSGISVPCARVCVVDSGPERGSPICSLLEFGHRNRFTRHVQFYWCRTAHRAQLLLPELARA